MSKSNIFSFFLVLLFIPNLLSQFSLSTNYNFGIYNSLTANAKQYLKTQDIPSISDFNLNLNYSIELSNKSILDIGVCFKQMKFELNDVIRKIEYRELDLNDNVIDSGFFSSKMKYKSLSKSFGFNLGYSYKLKQKAKGSSFIGFLTSTFIFERNKDNYYGSNDVFPDLPSDWYPLMIYTFPQNGSIGNRKGFFLSSINLSTYYRHVFQLHEKFSLAARVSLGTNLYSDWDQFKKYAWVGLGLEMGFGKVKTWNHSKQKD